MAEPMKNAGTTTGERLLHIEALETSSSTII